MQRSYSRGWPIHYDGTNWRYNDTKVIVNDSRPCKKCGHAPNKDGTDFCLGYINGISAACCGHGVTKKYFIKENKNEQSRTKKN